MRNNITCLLITLTLCFVEMSFAEVGGGDASIWASQQQQDASKQDSNQPNQTQKKDQQKKGQQGANGAQQPSGQQQGAQQPGAQQPPPQQQGTQNIQSKQGDGKPAPLFGGTLNLKSSRQTKDSATLGFNGVDPNGQVQKSFLSASVTGQDNAKAALIAVYKVNDPDLAQFIQDGGLNTVPPPQKSAN